MSIIEIDNLVKNYGKSRGISGISLNVEKGEIFGFIGPNGAGKSTTIRTLMGLIHPTSGSARIFGQDVRKYGKEVRNRIGYLPSESDYYEKMTVKEILQYSAKFYKVNADKKMKELAEMFNLDLKRQIIDLSLGNKKKVSIVQCFMHNPELIILDEPTNGLDPLMQAKFIELVRETNKAGTTFFFSSHVLNEVEKICGQVAVIKEGSIIANEDITHLRGKHLSNIKIFFHKEQDISKLQIPGMVSVEKIDGYYKLVYSGEVNELLKFLSKQDIAKITIEEPSLEEIFMHYYSNKEAK